MNIKQTGANLARPRRAIFPVSATPYLTRLSRGISLVELMIATTLGMFVVLVITGLVVASKSAQSTQQEASEIQDTARYALDNISRSVRQAGFVHIGQNDAPLIDTQNLTASVMGLDASSLLATKYGIDSPVPFKKNAHSNNFSDVLTIRFFGSGIPGDGTVLNCAGFAVPGPTKPRIGQDDRGWSIYYVAHDVNDEPALFCKYKKSDTRFSAQAIARGVESFQVLYGINMTSTTDQDDSGVNTTQFFNAQQITALDSGIPESDLNKKTHWKKVTTIKVAMLLRGATNSRMDTSTTVYNLFGENYSSHSGGTDKGTQINEMDIPFSQRNRLRKVNSTTIQLRNALD